MALGVIAPQAPAFFRSLARLCGKEFLDPEAMVFFNNAAQNCESPGSPARDQSLGQAVKFLGDPGIQKLIQSHAPKIFGAAGFLNGDAKREVIAVGKRNGSLAVGHGRCLEVLSRRKQAVAAGLFPDLLPPHQSFGYLPHTLSQWAGAKLFGCFFDAAGHLQATSFNLHYSLQVFLPAVWERSLGPEATHYVDGFSAAALRRYEDQVWDASQQQILDLYREGFQFPDSLLFTHQARESEVSGKFYELLAQSTASAHIVALYQGAARFYRSGQSDAGLPSNVVPLFRYLHPDVVPNQWKVSDITQPEGIVRYKLPLQLANNGAAVQFKTPSLEDAVTKPVRKIDPPTDGVVQAPVEDANVTLMAQTGQRMPTLRAPQRRSRRQTGEGSQ